MVSLQTCNVLWCCKLLYDVRSIAFWIISVFKQLGSCIFWPNMLVSKCGWVLTYPDVPGQAVLTFLRGRSKTFIRNVTRGSRLVKAKQGKFLNELWRLVCKTRMIYDASFVCICFTLFSQLDVYAIISFQHEWPGILPKSSKYEQC